MEVVEWILVIMAGVVGTVISTGVVQGVRALISMQNNATVATVEMRHMKEESKLARQALDKAVAETTHMKEALGGIKQELSDLKDNVSKFIDNAEKRFEVLEGEMVQVKRRLDL